MSDKRATPCACGCGRMFSKITGWDGMHNTGRRLTHRTHTFIYIGDGFSECACGERRHDQ